MIRKKTKQILINSKKKQNIKGEKIVRVIQTDYICIVQFKFDGNIKGKSDKKNVKCGQ